MKDDLAVKIPKQSYKDVEELAKKEQRTRRMIVQRAIEQYKKRTKND